MDLFVCSRFKGKRPHAHWHSSQARLTASTVWCSDPHTRTASQNVTVLVNTWDRQPISNADLQGYIRKCNTDIEVKLWTFRPKNNLPKMVSHPLFSRKEMGSLSNLTSEDALTNKKLELTRTKQYASGGSTNSAYFVMQSGWKLSCSRNDIANTPRRCSAYDRYEK